MNVLLTGGAGYIGSHTAVVLANKNIKFSILDNFSNGKVEAIDRLQQVVGFNISVIRGDVRDTSLLVDVMTREKFDAVIHFAAFKSINESIAKPVEYYDNNVNGMISLVQAMTKVGCKTLIFSSTAAIYSPSMPPPFSEDFLLEFSNPYAHTKLICEQILKVLLKNDPSWRIGILRYFNPVGAHESGLIGEDAGETPTNLVPSIARVVMGRDSEIKIFGDDYPTVDGTGVRDFVHVMDLAEGHMASLYALEKNNYHLVNLGTGRGYTVLEIIKAFEKILNRSLSYRMYPRREGDLPIAYATTSLAEKLLGWRAKRDLEDMCSSVLNWQQGNPLGYSPKQ
jgi:UDP-glucose 4-epimerase